MEFPFWKMHGAGNSYVFLYQKRKEVRTPEAFARWVSSPGSGIGADGLILMEPSSLGDGRMLMYNADGSRGRMCGNGIRCMAKYLYDNGLAGREQKIETDAGIRAVSVLENTSACARVRVDMERPRKAGELAVEADGIPYHGCAVSMGNPHFVLQSPDCDAEDVGRVGPALENHPSFPDRTNVEFVTPVDRKTCRMRVWERGSGETAACGTGACAAVVALTLTGMFPKGRRIEVRLKGGTLFVSYGEDGRVSLEGPAAVICKGTLFWREPL